MNTVTLEGQLFTILSAEELAVIQVAYFTVGGGYIQVPITNADELERLLDPHPSVILASVGFPPDEEAISYVALKFNHKVFFNLNPPGSSPTNVLCLHGSCLITAEVVAAQRLAKLSILLDNE